MIKSQTLLEARIKELESRESDLVHKLEWSTNKLLVVNAESVLDLSQSQRLIEENQVLVGEK